MDGEWELHWREPAAGLRPFIAGPHRLPVLQKPHDTDYGSRECALRDPEGNRWSFGTYRGATRRR